MKKRKPKPAAFMSYARLDDKYGHVTRFCEHLSHEIGACIGEDFLIFQDRENILGGQNWKERIKESLNEVTFLIPIITPSFFKRRCCRYELQQFIEHEKKLERNDLILPVYYISCDADTWAGDNLAQAIAEHACANWQKLRSKSIDSQEVREALAELGVQIRDALERVQASENTDALKSDADVTRRPVEDGSFTSLLIGKTLEKLAVQIRDTHGSVQASEKREVPEPDACITRRSSAKTEPPIRVVDPMHHGDYTTITEAIEAADPGDRILVSPGLYHEGLVIDQPGLEIIGDGNLDDVVVQAVGMDALSFLTTMGRVVNLTLRQIGDVGQYGVNIVEGRLELEECDITSHGMACVAIHGGADPRLRRNRIHDGKRSGVVAYWTEGVLEDNDIFGNGFAGVEIIGGNTILRRNRINKNGYWAVSVSHGCGGTIEDNDLRCNAEGAWNISDDSEPNLRRARNKE